jgi:hypothetical protein
MRERIPEVRERIPEVRERIPDVRERIPDVRECVPDVRERVPDLEFGRADLRRVEGMIFSSGDDDFHAVTSGASRAGIGGADLI